MSTSFYGSLPSEIVTSSENAKSVPIPITSTVTRTYVEYTSSPSDVGSADMQTKKFTKYLDEADLDFEKTFQQQSAIVSTVSQIVGTTTTIVKESTSNETSDGKTVTSTTTTTTVVSSTEQEDDQADEKKLWEKPLGKR
jgi:hypothetical protein